MKKIESWMACGVAVVALFAAGCDDTAQGVKQDAAENTAAVAQTADKAAEKVEEAGKDAAQVVQGAGREIKQAAQGAAKEAGESAVVSPTVSGAIAQDPELNADTNHIEVTTENGFVYLRGTVTTEALKKKATDVVSRDLKRIEAKETVKNELTVGPKKP